MLELKYNMVKIKFQFTCQKIILDMELKISIDKIINIINIYYKKYMI